jgi:hypothetical protein
MNIDTVKQLKEYLNTLPDDMPIRGENQDYIFLYVWDTSDVEDWGSKTPLPNTLIIGE